MAWAHNGPSRQADPLPPSSTPVRMGGSTRLVDPPMRTGSRDTRRARRALVGHNPGPLGPPPADFDSRPLPMSSMNTKWWRDGDSTRSAIYFGTSETFRFNAPAGQFGVLYLARSIDGAFAETHLRGLSAHVVRTIGSLIHPANAAHLARLAVKYNLALVP